MPPSLYAVEGWEGEALHMLPKCFPRESPQQVCPDPESKTDHLVRGMLWEPGVISAGEEQGSSMYTSGQGVGRGGCQSLI